MNNYAQIRSMDISDGPGVRVSIFLQGCAFHCKDCFNSETWDFEGGKPFTNETLNTLLDLAKKDFVKGLSILGGEPMHPYNLENTLKVAKKFKETYPNKTIWLWTGYLFENLSDQQKEVLDYLDVIVDGQFKAELKDLRLQYRGSSNQRVIDIKKTFQEGKIVSFI